MQHEKTLKNNDALIHWHYNLSKMLQLATLDDLFHQRLPDNEVNASEMPIKSTNHC